MRRSRSKNLAADASDAERLRERSLGCPLPRELFGQRGGRGEGEGGEEGDAPAAATADSSNDSLSHPAAFSRCNSIPEQLHPHSFRATFGHNTNVFAARKRWVRVVEGKGGDGGERASGRGDSSLLRLGRPVGVFGPSDPLTSWLPTTRAGVGMGGRLCSALPFEVKVAHRCPCGGVAEEKQDESSGAENEAAAALAAASSCRAQEELVGSLAKRGLMPPLHGTSEASVALLGGR